MNIETRLDDRMPVGCGCPSCARLNGNGPALLEGEPPPPGGLEPPNTNGPDELLSGSVWTNNGNGITLYFNFWNALPSYYAGNDPEANGFRAFTNQMKAATYMVLDLIETFTNITFVETTNEGQTHLGFAQANIDPQAGAWAYYPHPHPKGGDVWTNRMHVSETSLPEGGYDFYTLLHEVGHALGLQHTFEAGLTGPQNTEQYSVMAYDWAPWGATFAQSYMLYDIYALQMLYGTNNNHNTGNTTYTLVSGDALTIWDSGGTDTLDGSALSGNLTIRLDAGTFSSIGLTDNFSIAYGVTIENANGGSGNDTIYGNAANNTILGNGGNDTIHNSAGNDTLNGGLGSDTVVFTTNLSNFLFTFVDATTVIVQDTVGSYGTDTLINFENFVFNGVSYTRAQLEDEGQTAEMDRLNVRMWWDPSGFKKVWSNNVSEVTLTAADIGIAGAGNVLTMNRIVNSFTVSLLQDVNMSSIRIDGEGGNDTITLNGTNTHVAAILTGGAGNDTLTVSGLVTYDELSGGDGNDTLFAGGGNDRLMGDGGNDILHGEAGDDRLYGHIGDDELRGGAGLDILYGHDGNDTLYGDDHDDDLYGLQDNDTLHGGNGNDRLYGGDGIDTLNGDAGNDRLEGENGNDTLNGGAGQDKLYGGAGDDILNGGDDVDNLYAGDGHDTVNGDGGNDFMYGNNGNDILNGGAGNDEIYGDAGTDTLIGGLGRDFLYGGAGSDVFGFTQLDGEVERIQDFVLNGGERDSINITDILSGFTQGVDDISDFVHFNYKNATRTDILVNVDGNGNDWVTIAMVKGSDMNGVTAASLLASGQLIVNDSLV